MLLQDKKQKNLSKSIKPLDQSVQSKRHRHKSQTVNARVIADARLRDRDDQGSTSHFEESYNQVLQVSPWSKLVAENKRIGNVFNLTGFEKRPIQRPVESTPHHP